MADRTCVIEGCGKVPTARIRWCSMHYYRLRTHGTFDLPPRRPRVKVICSGEGCETAVDAINCTSGLCGRCYRKQYHGDHAEEQQAYNSAWREANAERVRENWAAFYEANAERLRAVRSAYYRQNREAVLANAARYREEHPTATADWRRQNPERFSIANRSNQANVRAERLDEMADRITASDLHAVIARDGMRCHICTYPIADLNDLNFDHVIPLAKGGANAVSNIRPAHKACNERKHLTILT